MFAEEPVLDSASHRDRPTFEHGVAVPTNIWNNPSLFRAVHKHGLNAFAYQRRFRALAERAGVEASALGLPLSNQAKDTLARRALSFFKHLKVGLRLGRVSLRAVFVVVLFHFLRGEFEDGLVDLDLAEALVVGDGSSRRRTLGLYLHIHKRRFGEEVPRDFRASLQGLVRRLVGRYLARTDPLGDHLVKETRVAAFVTRVADFSGDLQLSLKTKKLRNVAAAMAYLGVTVGLGDRVTCKNFCQTILAGPEGPRSGVQGVEDRLWELLCYNSVTAVATGIFDFFRAYLREFRGVWGRNLGALRAPSRLRSDYLLLSSLVEDAAALRRHLGVLIAVCWSLRQTADSQGMVLGPPN